MANRDIPLDPELVPRAGDAGAEGHRLKFPEDLAARSELIETLMRLRFVAAFSHPVDGRKIRGPAAVGKIEFQAADFEFGMEHFALTPCHPLFDTARGSG